MKKVKKCYLIDWSISYCGNNSSGFNSVLQVIETDDIEKEKAEFDEYIKDEDPDNDDLEEGNFDDDSDGVASYSVEEITKTEYNILKKYVSTSTPGIQQY